MWLLRCRQKRKASKSTAARWSVTSDASRRALDFFHRRKITLIGNRGESGRYDRFERSARLLAFDCLPGLAGIRGVPDLMVDGSQLAVLWIDEFHGCYVGREGSTVGGRADANPVLAGIGGVVE